MFTTRFPLPIHKATTSRRQDLLICNAAMALASAFAKLIKKESSHAPAEISLKIRLVISELN